MKHLSTGINVIQPVYMDQNIFGEIHFLKETLELMEEAGLIGCIDSKFIDSSRNSIKQSMLSIIEEKVNECSQLTDRIDA